VSGPRILVIDDEPQLRRALSRTLEGHGYSVREAEDGASGHREFDAFKPDVVLLDLMLPDTTGIELSRLLRTTSQTPIIILSVMGEDRAKVAALDEGADDYLTKPFSTDELLARIRVALRRGSTARQQQPLVAAGPLTMDLLTRDVRVSGAPVKLTPTEYSLLKYLALNSGRILTHPMILRAVWGEPYTTDTHLLRTYINQLRTKLGQDAASLIRTDPGVGYRFVEPGVETLTTS
jgi:two-component system KDP operon response regulator KdpE